MQRPSRTGGISSETIVRGSTVARTNTGFGKESIIVK